MPAPPPESEPAIVHTIGGGSGGGSVDGELVPGLLVLVLAIIMWRGLNALAVQRSKAARRRGEEPRCLRAMERGRLVVLGHASRLCVMYMGVCGCSLEVWVGMRSRLARQTPEIV